MRDLTEVRSKIHLPPQDHSHSNSSMKYIGTYDEGVTEEDIHACFQGSWGGYIKEFGNGSFIYIAETGD